MAPSLIGPPSLRQSPTPAAQPPAKTPSGDPFIDLMVADFNNLAQNPPRPQMGFTENGSATFVTTGDPCLDLFFHVVPNTPASYLNQQLPLAWAHNALTTLKLICNLRGVRGTGKSDKEGFYTAAFWLHKHHPKTLACNVASLAEFGYFKDLPEILYRLLEGEDVRKKQKSDWMMRKSGGAKIRKAARVPFFRGRGGRRGGGAKRGRGGRRGNNYNKNPVAAKEIRVLNSMERAKWEKEKASALRKEKFAAMAKKAVERYQRDPDYRFLHERVSDLFAECLKLDMESFKANQYKKISLAAKWCPSLDSSFDRATLLCESIARKVFARESYPEYEGVEDAHYAYRVRDRLRKDVLVPLRIVLELPEVYMGANLWGAIPYNRVASVAMKLYKEKFLKHDEERFKKYLEDVKAGKSTIAAGALLPHEIIASLNDGDGGQVAELQWKRVVEDLLKEGKMKNCLAVCDVSGSMHGTPMDVCVALGMLVAELNEEPWKGKVITFSANPQLHLIQGNDLSSKSEFVKRMDWGGNTDFQKVFDLILQVAVNGNLKPEQMIKRVFVFSDMEFDEASGYGGYGGYGMYGGYGGYGRNQVPRGWETDYEVIQRKYREKGYGDAVPQIVFWNLRDSKATPVPGTQPGVALLSGFSKNLLKLFLDNDGEIRPDTTMEAAISGPEYQKLVVLD
ncbi:PREDICTED: uncharacterized protein LOC101314465 [Fragaria vesca subsp. vesca]|uniref:uncharacterized protein LOC101314465 n=1 Tax=Fragaria vesca subsp. vesca TaxID=101020 RepID=UPI0002C34B29|nr:PREDICTED: uncharacterized protein LOC101314465 [Fragaria vesca subsp. vesca]